MNQKIDLSNESLNDCGHDVIRVLHAHIKLNDCERDMEGVIKIYLASMYHILLDVAADISKYLKTDIKHEVKKLMSILNENIDDSEITFDHETHQVFSESKNER